MKSLYRDLLAYSVQISKFNKIKFIVCEKQMKIVLCKGLLVINH